MRKEKKHYLAIFLFFMIGSAMLLILSLLWEKFTTSPSQILATIGLGIGDTFFIGAGMALFLAAIKKSKHSLKWAFVVFAASAALIILIVIYWRDLSTSLGQTLGIMNIVTGAVCMLIAGRIICKDPVAEPAVKTILVSESKVSARSNAPLEDPSKTALKLLSSSEIDNDVLALAVQMAAPLSSSQPTERESAKPPASLQTIEEEGEEASEPPTNLRPFLKRVDSDTSAPSNRKDLRAKTAPSATKHQDEPHVTQRPASAATSREGQTRHAFFSEQPGNFETVASTSFSSKLELSKRN